MDRKPDVPGRLPDPMRKQASQLTGSERWILRLYPARLRKTEGDEITQWWRDHVAATRSKPWGLRHVGWVRDIAQDVLRAHYQERVEEPSLYDQNAEDVPALERLRRGADQIWADVQFATRAVRRRPGPFVMGAGTLGAAVGALTLVLGVADQVLLQPLPYPDAGALVQVGKRSEDPAAANAIYALSALDFFDVRERTELLEGVAASRGGLFTLQATLTTEENALGSRSEPVAHFGAYVSAGFFDLLKTPPSLGRSFTTEEDANGLPRVVLSHALWQRLFAGRTDVLGSVLSVDREPWTVVGVMPADFTPPEGLYQQGAELWVPFGRLPREWQEDRSNAFLVTLGRLADGADLEQARGELATIGSALSSEYPDAGDRIFGAVPLHVRTVGDFGRTLAMLLGAAAVLFLVAGVNVASLLLASSIDRRREFAVRRSIGAQRSHIVSLLLNETLLLGFVAGLVGAGLVWLGHRLVGDGLPIDIPRLEEFAAQPSEYLLAMGIATFAALIFGLVPALSASRLTSSKTADAGLSSGARGAVGSRSEERKRMALVAAETALAVILIVGATLLLTSFKRLQDVDLGFSPTDVEAISVNLQVDGPESERAFYRSLLDKVRSVPGVEAAGIASITPLSRGRQMQGIDFENSRFDELHPERDTYSVHYQVASEGYLESMLIPIQAGRGFDTRDGQAGTRTALINQTVADEIRALGEEPIGQRFEFGNDGLAPGTFEVVGVVGAIQHANLSDPTARRIYLHFDQVPRGRMRVFARRSGEASVLPALREAVWQLDPKLPVLASFAMEELHQEALAAPRFYAQLIGSLAVISWVLALLGVYSALSFLVASRRREVGLRLALGATERLVLRTILNRGLMSVGVGAAVGLTVAYLATEALTGFLFGVTHQAPGIYLLVAAIVLAAGCLASLVPGLRAMRVPPAIALAE